MKNSKSILTVQHTDSCEYRYIDKKGLRGNCTCGAEAQMKHDAEAIANVIEKLNDTTASFDLPGELTKLVKALKEEAKG